MRTIELNTEPTEQTVKPVIKLYGLSTLDERTLDAAFLSIVATALVALADFGVEKEGDVLLHFLPDYRERMPRGQVHVEVDLPMAADAGDPDYGGIARSFGTTLKKLFPGARVQCIPYRFDKARSWVSD